MHMWGFTPMWLTPSIPQSFLSHLIDALTIWKVRRIDEAGDPSSSLGFSQVQSEGARVSQDVTSNGFRRIPPHGVRLRMNLIRYEHERIVHIGQLLQVLQVPIQFLLPIGEHATANVFGSEMGGQ